MAAAKAIRRKWHAVGLLAVSTLFAFSGIVSAVFPPLYQQSGTPATVPPPVTIDTVDPPVVVIDEVPDPVVVKTPEPATLISGLTGIMLAIGYVWLKRRKQREQPSCAIGRS